MAINFDFENQEITLTAPHSTDLTCQDLINAIRDAEDGEEGIQYGKIADSSGKADLGGSVATGITIALVDPWQLVYPAGSYQAVIRDGNLVGGPSGNPVAYTAGVQVKLVQSAAGTISTVTSGSGLDTAQDTKLTRIHALLDTIEGALDHQEVMRILLASMSGKISGADATEISIRDLADSKNRIVSTVDEYGNRTSVTLDAS